MSASSADRNLLFGFLALQNDFVTREDLIAAVSVWLQDKSRALADILRERQLLSADEHQLLSALARVHLSRHGGDLEASLANLSSIGSVREQLRDLGDRDLNETLANVSAAGDDRTQFAETLTAGTPTSGGLRFRVLRPHARGGLGEVYVAEDTELHREVALKQIQIHCADDPDSRARFLLEAEITGGLEHPGIVPVYGLGHYADGRPFYAMRFIRGDSLKEAVDRYHRAGKERETSAHEKTLAFRKLLGRFIDVCEAIGYAHARGVLHRDLKPGNIMLGRYGETLVVDWGLAKPVGRKDAHTEHAENTLHPFSASGSQNTQMGSLIGTPAYMSPEQASGRLDQLDTRSDVYSLGATLYHVITGRPPFAKDDDTGTILNKVRSGEFARPREVTPLVSKSLEAICLKAMALRSQDRYQSPAQLADDIEKWLADEPVSAYREPFTVQLRRWTRRHRAIVASVSAALLVAMASLVVVLVLLARHSQQLADKNVQLDRTNTQLTQTNADLTAARNLAEVKRKEAEEARVKERLAREDAEARRQDAELARAAETDARQQAETISNYLVQAFRSPDPERDGRTITVAEVLDRAVSELEGQFENEPGTKATLLDTIGITYLGLGSYEPAIPLFQDARALYASKFGPEHRTTLSSTNNLAGALVKAGRFEEAIPLFEESLDAMKATLGLDDPKTIFAISNLASAYLKVGRRDAVPLYEQALKLMQDKFGADDPQTVQCLGNLAGAYAQFGPLEKAISLYEETIELMRAKLGSENPQTLQMMHNLAGAYQQAGFVEKSISLIEATLALRKSKLGEDHPDTLRSTASLARGHALLGAFDKAIPMYEQTLELMKAALGDDHPDTLQLMNLLAQSYFTTRRTSEAIPLLEKTVALTRSKLGAEHPSTIGCIHDLAVAYSLVGRNEQAIPLYEESLKFQKMQLGTSHPATMRSMGNLALAYHSTGQLEEAISLFEETLELMKANLGVKHQDTFQIMNNLARAYFAAGRSEESLSLLEETVARMTEQFGADHLDTLVLRSNLGQALRELGRAEEAIPILEQTLERLAAKLGSDHPVSTATLKLLAESYLQAKQRDEGIRLIEESIASSRKRLATNGRPFADELAWAGYQLLTHKEFALAETYLQECRTIYEQTSPDDWFTWNAKSMFGAALAGQGKLAEAEPLLIEGYQGIKQHALELPDKSIMTDAIQRLIDLYNAWDKPDEANKWREQLPTQ